MTAVHVAGRGMVTAFGAGRCRTLDAIFRGDSAVRPRVRTADVEVATSVAAELEADAVDGEATIPLVLRIARRAAVEALSEGARPDRATVGLVLASTKADLGGIEGAGDGLGRPSRLARRLADDLGLGGRVQAVSCACASGLSAIALARLRLRRGERRVLVVGVDVLSRFVLRGFSSMMALDPVGCRPFDRARRGLTLGEGAGALLLSTVDDESIGVRVAGCGEANEAHHVSGPDPEGRGLELAGRRALAAAGVERGDVDAVHAHGTGTPFNDAMEANGLVRLFGGRTPPTFGTKAQTGHALGAAGVIESIVAIEALRRARVPANVGLDDPDVDARLSLVRREEALTRARVALKLAGGFGGMQAAVVFAS
ncbi:MAG: beta-ketoacyl synthase N-terminal-like domain-containing protein [Planctomycetota bacterium JB042]